MKLNPINNLSFSSKIIDSHAHIGKWGEQTYGVSAIDIFSKESLSNGDTVEKMLVSNLSCLDNNDVASEMNGNIATIKAVNKNSKIAPLAVCNPQNGSVANIIKLFDEYPNSFVGLKFHPDKNEIFASDKLFEPYLKFAQERKLPCLFHCGINWENGNLVSEERRFSSPWEIYKAAKKIPDTPVIMAHLGSGGERVHSPAIEILLSSINNNDANIYADISWVDINNSEKPTIINLIKKLKNTAKGDMTNRILFGSDIPIGEYSSSNGLSGKLLYEKVISDIKNAIKKNFDDANELIDKIFYRNAKDLFFNDKPPRHKKNKIPKTSKSKLGIATGLVVTILGFAGYFIYDKPKQKQNMTYPIVNNTPCNHNT